MKKPDKDSQDSETFTDTVLSVSDAVFLGIVVVGFILLALALGYGIAEYQLPTN